MGMVGGGGNNEMREGEWLWWELEIMTWDDNILPQTFGWQNLWKGLALKITTSHSIFGCWLCGSFL